MLKTVCQVLLQTPNGAGASEPDGGTEAGCRRARTERHRHDLVGYVGTLWWRWPLPPKCYIVSIYDFDADDDR